MKKILALIGIVSGVNGNCYCEYVCKLWGDPHIKTFSGKPPDIKLQSKDNLTILQIGKFVVNAGVSKKGYIREINWGKDTRTLQDCNGKQTILDPLYYSTGNVKLTGETSCKFKSNSKSNLHLDIKVTKLIDGQKENVVVQGECEK